MMRFMADTCARFPPRDTPAQQPRPTRRLGSRVGGGGRIAESASLDAGGFAIGRIGRISTRTNHGI